MKMRERRKANKEVRQNTARTVSTMKLFKWSESAPRTVEELERFNQSTDELLREIFGD